MCFSNYPAALPFILALHEKETLKKLIDELSEESVAPIIKESVAESVSETPSHPFVDAFDKMLVMSDKVARTEIGGLTNTTTSDACLDLYYGINIESDHQTLLLEKAWEQDRDMTLRIIFYTRSIHRGKSDKESFLRAFCWLLEHHPKTAITNLHVLIDGTIRTDAILQKKNRESEKKESALNDGWDMWTDEDCDQKKEEKLETRRDFKTHGYWKDLATIVNIYCQDEVHDRPFSRPFKALKWPKPTRAETRSETSRERRLRREPRQTMSPKERLKDTEPYIHAARLRSLEEQKEATQKRREIREERNNKVRRLLQEDKVYRSLHLTVARLFAEQLQVDLDQLQMNKQLIQQGKLQQLYPLSNNLSLASKWAPSLRASHDKHTFLATSIAEILFPPKGYQEKDESREHYLNKARDLYRKVYLVPLRAALDLTEHHMAPGKWNTIDYRHIPAVCMQQNVVQFFKHDQENLVKYMDLVSKGEKKVSGATLTPNELVYKIKNPDTPENLKGSQNSKQELQRLFLKMEQDLTDGQWNTLLESLRNSTLIDNPEKVNKNSKHVGLGECIALCDVSGSMLWPNTKPERDSMLPYYAAIGLSLVIANLAKPPFHGKIISFTNVPEMVNVDTSKPFHKQVECVSQAPWGEYTDVRAVFVDLLLPMAKKFQLRQEDMVKRIFIFSDMEFNCQYSRHDQFLTSYELIRQDYKEAGYEMPELVWWNMALPDRYSDMLNAPVTSDDEGVCLLSGFSPSMLKTFLDGDVEDDSESDCDPGIATVEAVKKEEEEVTTGASKAKVKSAEDPVMEIVDTEEIVDAEEEHDESAASRPKKDEKLSPGAFMKKAVYHESFSGLVVVD
ncbi:hypothetical protein K501DRAFT_281789 [Backusella circina FSU 941]|nr:hypothetical protein K501DRAFT_281789 [Backusella circina FSU 941]